MANLKDIKRRITTVQSTQKITSAMKMVAAAKLRRAQEAIEQARPYATRMRSTLEEAVEHAKVHIAEHGEMRAADFKNALGTTRKFAIPILEHLDARGVFINVGGVRKLKP